MPQGIPGQETLPSRRTADLAQRHPIGFASHIYTSHTSESGYTTMRKSVNLVAIKASMQLTWRTGWLGSHGLSKETS